MVFVCVFRKIYIPHFLLGGFFLTDFANIFLTLGHSVVRPELSALRLTHSKLNLLCSGRKQAS